MANKVSTKTTTPVFSATQVAGLTGLMLVASAAIAVILTVFLFTK